VSCLYLWNWYHNLLRNEHRGTIGRQTGQDMEKFISNIMNGMAWSFSFPDIRERQKMRLRQTSWRHYCQLSLRPIGLSFRWIDSRNKVNERYTINIEVNVSVFQKYTTKLRQSSFIRWSLGGTSVMAFDAAELLAKATHLAFSPENSNKIH